MIDELAEIREAFALESAEMLTEIEESLLALDSNQTSESEFNRLFRAIHTLKGSASIVSADNVESFCHALEHLLVKARDDKYPLAGELLSLLLKCHDHIKALIVAFEAGQEDTPPKHIPLLNQISLWQMSPPANAEPASDQQSEHEAPEIEAVSQQTESEIHPQEETSAMQKVVKVDAHKLDQLINLVVELVTTTSELEASVKRVADATTQETASAVSQLVKQIQERAMVFRMVPVGDLFKRFQRLVHDLSVSTGKQIKLITTGIETELDKVMAERLREPLVHLIRNAIDHGLETPQEREANGKSACGTIQMNAFHEAGNIIIEVQDDGCGINRDRVLAKATARGLVRSAELTDREILSLIFEPGFSTMDETTLLSGRGVGMDVVKRTIEDLRGKIDIESVDGKGTCFQLRMPLSLALIDGFMVLAGTDLYILPMDQVEETIDLPKEKEAELKQRGYLNLRDEALPCIDLNHVLRQESISTKARFVVVIKQNDRRVGLAVDQLHGEVKAVIKPLGRIYRDARIISGATILGDGRIALIIDLNELLRT